MKNLDVLSIFVQVADSRSFTKVADRMGISASGVSKAVSRLEDELQVKLLHRTTRSVGLTDDGVIFYEHCRHILAEIDDAELAIASSRARPHGRLRVQMPVGFGRHVVVPQLPDFLEQNPELTLDLELSDRTPDLVHDGLDAAVVLGPQADSSLLCRKMYRTRVVCIASPDYIARHGEPKTPDDLDHHACLGHLEPRTGRYRLLELQKGERLYSKHPAGRLNINYTQSLVDMAIVGMGIARAATFVAAPAVREGRLRIVLKDYVGMGPELSLVHLPSRHRSPRVQALTQFLSRIVPRRPLWDDILD